MTNRALIREADLIRMARVAKREGVTVWMEIDGKKTGVSPDVSANSRQEEIYDDEEICL